MEIRNFVFQNLLNTDQRHRSYKEKITSGLTVTPPLFHQDYTDSQSDSAEDVTIPTSLNKLEDKNNY